MKDSIRIIVLGLSIAGIMTAALLWADRSKSPAHTRRNLVG